MIPAGWVSRNVASVTNLAHVARREGCHLAGQRLANRSQSFGFQRVGQTKNRLVVIQNSEFRLQHHRPGTGFPFGQPHLRFRLLHGLQVEAQPAVIGFVLDRFLGRRPSGENRRKGVLRFAQEQSILPLQVHRPPALAVFPEFDIPRHIWPVPAQTFQLITTVGEFLRHALLRLTDSCSVVGRPQDPGGRLSGCWRR